MASSLKKVDKTSSLSNGSLRDQKKIIRFKNIVNEEVKCQLCYERDIRPDRYLFQCNHKSECIRCAEKFVLSNISKRISPACFDNQCLANIREDQKGLLQYFSISAKNQWLKFKEQRDKQNDRSNNSLPCRVPDCSGKIIKLRCIQCSTFYCPFCLEKQHHLGTNCQQQSVILSSTQKILKCPKCQMCFIKDGGCLKIQCTNCSFEWCEKCRSKWSFKHHTCLGFKSIKMAISGFREERRKKV